MSKQLPDLREQTVSVLDNLRKTSYLPWWYFRSRILNQKRPLQTVLFVTDYCNLKCKHCMEEGHHGSRTKPYEEIRKELEYSYKRGSRFIDFEGGEPTLWRDSEGRDLNDLYRLAKEVGFWSCTLTTNGQRPFGDTLADSVWVSVDGYGKYHDLIRGEGTFEKLDKNIRESGHLALSIAMAVNNRNYKSVGELIQYAKDNPAIQQIAFNFHTPFPGTEELMMDWELRNKVIDRIIAYKKKGYPVMNSVSGLRTSTLAAPDASISAAAASMSERAVSRPERRWASVMTSRKVPSSRSSAKTAFFARSLFFRSSKYPAGNTTLTGDSPVTGRPRSLRAIKAQYPGKSEAETVWDMP